MRVATAPRSCLCGARPPGALLLFPQRHLLATAGLVRAVGFNDVRRELDSGSGDRTLARGAAGTESRHSAVASSTDDHDEHILDQAPRAASVAAAGLRPALGGVAGDGTGRPDGRRDHRLAGVRASARARSTSGLIGLAGFVPAAAARAPRRATSRTASRAGWCSRSRSLLNMAVMAALVAVSRRRREKAVAVRRARRGDRGRQRDRQPGRPRAAADAGADRAAARRDGAAHDGDPDRDRRRACPSAASSTTCGPPSPTGWRSG